MELAFLILETKGRNQLNKKTPAANGGLLNMGEINCPKSTKRDGRKSTMPTPGNLITNLNPNLLGGLVKKLINKLLKLITPLLSRHDTSWGTV